MTLMGIARKALLRSAFPFAIKILWPPVRKILAKQATRLLETLANRVLAVIAESFAERARTAETRSLEAGRHLEDSLTKAQSATTEAERDRYAEEARRYRAEMEVWKKVAQELLLDGEIAKARVAAEINATAQEVGTTFGETRLQQVGADLALVVRDQPTLLHLPPPSSKE